MRRNIFIFFVLFVLLALSFPCSAQEEKIKLIPVTVGDVEMYGSLSNKEKRSFIFDFYKKNKEIGATDGQILNELLKLDVEDGQNSKLIQSLSLLGKRYRDIEHFVENSVEEINLNILEKNPGRIDLTIDMDNSDTWKNIKYFSIGERDINEYLKIFTKDKYFSETVSAADFSALLTSCADTGEGKVLMSLILFPDSGYNIVTQREGEAFTEIKTDFAGSENLLFDPVRYPFEKVFILNGKKAFGYDGIVYLPFFANLENLKENGNVKVTVTANVCKNGICSRQTTPPITYKTEKAVLEAPGCAKITQQFFSSPSAQKSGLELKKAFFKKDENEDVNLFIILKMSLFSVKEPNVLIQNEQGLLFSEPFINWDGDNMILKSRLLNPDQLKDAAELTINIGYPGRASKFKTQVKWDSSSFHLFSIFSFSILDFLSAFFLGIKFLFLTPVLTAFLMLGYQATLADRKSPEKTVSFYNGLGKMFYFWCIVFSILGLVGFYVLPSGVFFWGSQFLSPLVNFFLLIVFFAFAVSVGKIFDDVAVVSFSRRFSAVFSMFKAENVREQAGLITGFMIGCLLFITPMISLYYNIYILLSRSVIFYSLAFAAGISLPFLILSLFDEKAIKVFADEKTRWYVQKILPLPLYISAAFLAVMIGLQAGINVFCGLIVLIALAVFFLWKKPFLKIKRILLVLLLIGVIFIPFFPNEKGVSNWESVDFDEALLRKRVQEGKAVYLSVSESFCLSCYWNRLIMAKRGAPQEVQDGTLTIMRIGYNNPFLKKLVGQGGKYGLPLNIIFSPLAPEGRIVIPFFNSWAAQDIASEIFKYRESAPDPQSAPEQNQPDPAVKDIN